MPALRPRRAHRHITLLGAALSAALAVTAAAPAFAGLPTRTISLGHYQLHVSLSYQAQASNPAPTNNPAPAAGTGLRPYWNFSSQSESATLAASWSVRMELNKKGLGSTVIHIQPVHFPHALGELHGYERHALGSPGFGLAVNGSYSGTYYAPINETCYYGQSCPPRFTPIPFTCTLAAQNTAIAGILRTEWVETTNPAAFADHGYLNPLRPGAVSLGIAFALLPAHENSAKGGGKGAGPGGGEDGNSAPGFVSPSCPAEVGVFEPWLAESAMLSAPYEQGDDKPGSRLALFSLRTLIRRGRVAASFSGPAVSPTGCCAGTTTYTINVTAHRVH